MTTTGIRKNTIYFLLIALLAFLSFGTVDAFADVIIDNGDPGTSYTGTWKVSGGTEPYGDDSLWARDGDTYTWEINSQPSGVYEVLMWWSEWPSRATNISVDINHSTGKASITINQHENAGQWNSLGEYYFASSGSVVITAAYGSTVSTCADAVWFRFVSDNTPPTAYIDSISPNPAEPGQLVEFVGHGTDDEGSVAGYQWESSIDGLLSDTESFTNSSLTEGAHTISFRVQDNEGIWSEAVTQALIVGAIPTEIIIDNRDPQTSQTGTWSVSDGADPYGEDSVWSRDGTTFTWHFNPPQTGDYEVFIWWTDWPSRSDSVPVTINFEGDSETVNVNQQENGSQWNSLGIFRFDVNSGGSVSITSQPGPSSTCADAVKFNFIQSNDPPTATIDSITPNPADVGETVYFSGQGNDPDGTIETYSWDSSIDGHLSDEASFSTVLSEGTRTITFRVQDNEGEWSAPVTETLVVGNIPPVAFIDSISPNPAELEDVITFSGHGEDSDGTVTAYRWYLHADLSDQAIFTISASSLGPGVYTISFTVMDDKGKWSPVVTETLIIGNVPPTAIIDSITPNPANLGETVSFAGHGEDSDGSIAGYSWESSIDGYLSDTPTFTTSSLSLGNHTITFTVYDDEGAVSEPVTQVLTVDDIPIEVVIDNGEADTSYTGTWSVSGGANPYGADSFYSRDGATYTYTFTPTVTSYYEVFMWWTEWQSRSTNVPVEIQYAGGTATVYINQQQNGGQWNGLGEYFFESDTSYNVTIAAQPYPTSTCADAVKFVDISEPSPPVADFSADKTYGGAPYTIKFTDQSLGMITERLWDFGDGQTSTEENPSHEYATPGTYTVSLTVTNAGGSDTKTRENYINIVNALENIYVCEGYSKEVGFAARGIRVIERLGAVEDNGVWVYSNPDKNITYLIHFVNTLEGMEQALKEECAHIIFNGHANYGLSAVFATPPEVFAQQIDDIYFVDDDRFLNISTDMVSLKVDGMKDGQAYPNWEPYFKDGTCALMPYDFSEGLPPYNYYLTYTIPGDPTLYKVELSDGNPVERFPDSRTPAWFSPDGSPPDPVANPEYFITNPGTDFNHCEYVGDWLWAKEDDDNKEYRGYNYYYSPSGSGANTATWFLVVDYPGNYAVVASWQSDPANATNAKYTIQHSGGYTTVEVNQRENLELGWNPLGEYYFDEGVYTVQLSDDADGRVIADAVQLNPLDNPDGIVRAEFRANVTSGTTPLEVDFENLSYASEDIIEWYWDFGDGNSSNLEDPTHTYSTPGIYTVSLTVTDNLGREDTEVKEAFIVVENDAPLQAEFTSTRLYGYGRGTIRFTDQSSGNITEWYWDFGDGETGSGRNPRHLYATPGIYTVTLTISGPGGSDIETEVDFIHIFFDEVYTDNTYQYKEHFVSRQSYGGTSTFGKVVVNTGPIKIPEEELRYSRFFYGSCNSCNYFIGTLNRGIMFCTTENYGTTTGIDYLEYYLRGYSDEEILAYINTIDPSHEYINFNLLPPSMR